MSEPGVCPNCKASIDYWVPAELWARRLAWEAQVVKQRDDAWRELMFIQRQVGSLKLS